MFTSVHSEMFFLRTALATDICLSSSSSSSLSTYSNSSSSRSSPPRSSASPSRSTRSLFSRRPTPHQQQEQQSHIDPVAIYPNLTRLNLTTTQIHDDTVLSTEDFLCPPVYSPASSTTPNTPSIENPSQSLPTPHSQDDNDDQPPPPFRKPRRFRPSKSIEKLKSLFRKPSTSHISDVPPPAYYESVPSISPTSSNVQVEESEEPTVVVVARVVAGDLACSISKQRPTLRKRISRYFIRWNDTTTVPRTQD